MWLPLTVFKTTVETDAAVFLRLEFYWKKPPRRKESHVKTFGNRIFDYAENFWLWRQSRIFSRWCPFPHTIYQSDCKAKPWWVTSYCKELSQGQLWKRISLKRPRYKRVKMADKSSNAFMVPFQVQWLHLLQKQRHLIECIQSSQLSKKQLLRRTASWEAILWKDG